MAESQEIREANLLGHLLCFFLCLSPPVNLPFPVHMEGVQKLTTLKFYNLWLWP